MKFMTLTVYPVEKTGEVAAASDKGWDTVPKGRRPEAIYVMLAIPQFNVPPNSLVDFSICDADDAGELVARLYPQRLAGATIDVIPLLEVPIAGSAKAEKKYKG